MFRVLSAFCVVALCACVSGSRLIYPQLRAKELKALSSQEKHILKERSPEYHHEAFLGEQQAQEWEKLPTKDVKGKLRQVTLSFRSFDNFKSLFVFLLGNIQCNYQCMVIGNVKGK